MGDSATFTPLDQRVELVSVNQAAHVLGRPLAQVQVLSRSGALGTTYLAGNTPFYLRSDIEDLASRRRWSKEDLLALGAEGKLPGPAVVVIRQRDALPTNDKVRSWYGYRRDMDVSADPAERRQQDNASRMWWPVTAAHRDVVQRTAALGGFVPCIVTVGGLAVSFREITGMDYLVREEEGDTAKWAFSVRPAGGWAQQLNNTWIDSGPGRAILWWLFDEDDS